jgi:threonine dehydrogenase-like Zn-dependent dehydrogenase
MIAYAVLAALRLLGHQNHITQLLLLDFQAQLARDLGADEVIQLGKPGADAMERVLAITGGKRHKPIIGPDVMTGGFPLTFDCIGSPESVRDSLTYTASQGTVVLVGASGVVPKLDTTNVWTRELSYVGTAFYGPEPARQRRHTIDLTTELLSGEAGALVDPLITHTYPLEQYEEAVVANIERGRFRSVKTVFKPSERPS